MANLWNYGEIIKDPFYNTSFPRISTEFPLVPFASMSCFAPTTGSNLRVETVQQVTSDQNTPVSLAGSTFPQFLLLFETLRFSRTMCPHLSPTGFFLGGSGFRVASQSPTTRQFRISAPMLGLRLSHSSGSGSGSGEIWDFTQKPPTVWGWRNGQVPPAASLPKRQCGSSANACGAESDARASSVWRSGKEKPRWWFKFQIFSIFTPYLGKISNLTIIFFRWVGSTTK